MNLSHLREIKLSKQSDAFVIFKVAQTTVVDLKVPRLKGDARHLEQYPRMVNPKVVG